MTEQSMDTTKGQLGIPMSVIGSTCRNMGERLVPGAEVTQRQLHHQVHPSTGDREQRWELRTHCTDFRLRSRLDRVLSKFLRSKPLPGCSVVSVAPGHPV